MKCPSCGSEQTHVYRVEKHDQVKERWRECVACGFKFYTHELIQYDVPVRQKTGEYVVAIPPG